MMETLKVWLFRNLAMITGKTGLILGGLSSLMIIPLAPELKEDMLDSWRMAVSAAKKYHFM